MSQIVQRALDLLRPQRPHRLFPLCYVNEATRTNAKKIFDLVMQETELSPCDIEEIKRLVEESPKNDVRNLFNVVNWDGFTLLQRSVINNHIAVVKILIKKGCDINAGICSLPLHLACRLGHVHISQLLLSHGARADIECTVCYPDEHKLKTCPDQIYCLSYQPVYTPIMYALCGDHDLILPLLINHENSRQFVKTDFLLHEACKMGAYSCSRYLLEHYSEQMLQENIEGKTPLQISLVMDADSALFLMNHGAQLKDSVFLTENGSTLAELYRRKTSLGLIKATKFALEHGFRNHINARDKEGNTALYVLLKHVGRTVKSNIQSEYDREVQESIKMLLYHGANPNIPNHVGETALHVVLVDNPVRQLYVSRHGQVRRLKPILQEIYKVVEILLAHQADPGQRSTNIRMSPPLYYAIRIFQALQPDMFVVVKTALKQLFVLLSQPNCNVNATESYGLTMYVLLLRAAHRWITTSRSVNVAFCKSILPFLIYILQHFLKRGLDPNARLAYRMPRMEEAIESNYFKEILMFISFTVPEELCFYGSIRLLLVKLMQRGGNPNLLVYNLSGATVAGRSDQLSRPISIVNIIARSLFVRPDTTLLQIIDVVNLFYLSLVQNKLNEFIASLQHCLSTDLRDEVLPLTAQSYLQQISSTPRMLKQLCRISVAESLQWKISKQCRCSLLPLPKAILHYLNFDL